MMSEKADEKRGNIKATLKVVRLLLEVAAPYHKHILMAAIMFGMAMLLQMPIPIMTKYLIDRALPSGNLRTIDIVGLGLLGIVAAQVTVGLLNRFAIICLSSLVQYDLRMKIVRHVLSLPILFFRKRSVGYLLSRITADVDVTQGMLSIVVIEVPWSVVTLAIGLGLAFWLNWGLAVLCVCLLPVFCMFSLWSGNRARYLASRSREALALSTEDVEKTLSGIEVIKCLSQEQVAAGKAASSLSTAIDQEVRYQQFVAVAIAGLNGFTLTVSLAVLWLGARAVIGGGFTLGGLMAFMTALRYLFEPAAGIATKIVDLQRCTASGERVLELLGLTPERDGGVEIPTGSIRGAIEFKNVSFGYDGEKVLNGVSFSIAPGEKVALVGKSGAGKTTIVGLVLRLFEPWAGEVTIDGVDIRKVSIASLRKAIAFVPQDAFLFSDSILENIKMGDASASMEKVIDATRAAGLDRFLESCRNGYDKGAGAGGRCLSAGERQRVAIARALIRESPIVILDEATSEVDAETDAMIQESLYSICNGRTLLMIAHRLSTAVRADRIIVIDGGRIVDSGTHHDLITRCSVYQALWRADRSVQ